MNNEERQVTQYIVPANVSTSFEFFPGFGWKELIVVAITLGVGFLGFVATEQFITIQIRIGILVFPPVTAFFVVKRDANTGISLLNMLRNVKEFKKQQHLYLYKYNSALKEE